jgi:hypothetical protein
MNVVRVKFGRPREDDPADPELVKWIVYARDEAGYTWREVGEEFGMSHMGAYLLYKRWHQWVRDKWDEE